MKTICILASARTGSTFLADHFQSIDKTCLSTGEFFNIYTPKQIDIINEVFYKHKIPLTESYMEYLRYLKQFYNLSVYNVGKPINPYSMQMFYDVQEILEQLNYKYFVHKVVINALYQEGWIEQFVDSSDLVIINYRESIIDAFISHNKAMISGQWKNTKKYNIKYDKLITWDKEQYAFFVEKYREYYTDFFKHTLHKNKKYYLIKYEQLYNPNSMSILQEIIGKKYLLKKPSTIKQSRILNREDNFSNKDVFLKDFQSMDEVDKWFNPNQLTID
jgi:LPS sulfotransferase NodH|tara:strand:+ start:3296 stop:4120 length:825 start_codon:yes stop_codon:yes gene_type:complete